MKKRSPEKKKKRKTQTGRVKSHFKYSRLLNNVVDYLMSDCYLFSPLLASPNSSPRFLASQLGSSSTSGLGAPVKVKRRSSSTSTRLVQVVRDYLTSDSYMYGPLVASHSVASPKGHTHYAKKTTVEISKTKFTMKDNQTIIESSNATMEDRVSEDELPEDGIVVGSQKKSVRQEMVKRTVYHKCRSSSVPGAVDSKLRALIVE